MIVKWLSKPVGIYLQQGCPDEDYSQDASNFIKSWCTDDSLIETGIDGWSQGDFESGFSLGYDLRHYPESHG